MEGAYIEEIYSNPNASSIYPCFDICAFNEVVVCKCTFIFIIRICTYTKNAIMEVAASVYASSIYAHLQKSSFVYASSVYVHIWKRSYTTMHIRKVHIQKKFMVIQMHLPYMCASMYVPLRKLSSVNAHLYVSFVYVLIHKRTYTKDVIMEVVGFCICVVCICAFTKVAFVYAHLYIRKRAYTEDAHIWKTPLWK
jgi:hypothetical protein